jgi:prepilin peptidase dependent protein C
MMNQHKGFSLFEVLLSLMLVSTVVLALFAEQQQSRQLLQQLIVGAGAEQVVEQDEENYLANVNKTTTTSSALNFKQSRSYSGLKDDSRFRHAWFKYWNTAIHHRSVIGL